MASAFIFVDPYSFKIPENILRELMGFPRVGLFINVIWRWLNMAISQGDQEGMAKTLDSIFNGGDWRVLMPLNHDQRAEGCIELFREMTGAKWATRILLLGEKNAVKYMLLHLTNHDKGRDLMKTCIWKVCPEGGFHARFSDDPRQALLITREPDQRPLRDWVLEELLRGPCRWQDLIEQVRQEIWREPHLNSVIRDLRKEKVIGARGYRGPCVPRSNPELYLL